MTSTAYSAPSRVGLGFNPQYFSSTSSGDSSGNYLTTNRADSRYLQLSGGTETGVVNFSQGLAVNSVSSFPSGGTVTFSSPVSGITKAMVGLPLVENKPTDSSLSSSSANPIQSSAVYNALQNYLTTTNAASLYAPIGSYLTSSVAAATYLSIASASSLYAPLSSLSSYLTTSNATSTYLTISSASSTYAPLSSLSSYLTTSSAASIYAPLSSLSSYLTTSSAASTYLTISSASSTYAPLSSLSSYLTTSSAASTYLSSSTAASLYAPLSNPSISGTLKVNTLAPLTGQTISTTYPLISSGRMDAPILGVGIVQLYSGYSSLTLPTVSNITCSGAVKTDTIQTATTNGNLTLPSLNSVTVNGGVTMNTLNIYPTSWNQYSGGANQGQTSTAVTSYGGTFTAGSGSISFPTISLTNSPKNGILLGYIQMFYTSSSQTIKVSANVWSCIGALQLNSGVKCVNAVLANTASNIISVTFNIQNNVYTASITGNCNSVGLLTLISPLSGVNPTYPTGQYSNTCTFNYTKLVPNGSGGFTQTTGTQAITLTNASFNSLASLASAVQTAMQAAFSSNSTSYLLSVGTDNKLTIKNILVTSGTNYVLSNAGASTTPSYWSALGMVGNESTTGPVGTTYTCVSTNAGYAATNFATYIDYQFTVFSNDG